LLRYDLNHGSLDSFFGCFDAEGALSLHTSLPFPEVLDSLLLSFVAGKGGFSVEDRERLERSVQFFCVDCKQVSSSLNLVGHPFAK
jgi:hypothetical protein